MLTTDLQTEQTLASSKRPIPLVARPDLVFQGVGFQGNAHWVVKIPASLRYFRLRPEQYFLLRSLDGQSTLETLQERLRAEFPSMVLQLTDIQRLAIDLYEKGLAYSNRPGQGASLVANTRRQRWQKLKSTLSSLLCIQVPGWNPHRALDWLSPFSRWMFHPAAVCAAVAAMLVAWVLLLVQFEEFQGRLPAFHEFFAWPNVMYLWITLAAAKLLHELGHALSCRHFGGECHSIGIMFLVFSPTLYCDVSDSWMLRSKWQRIAIGGAGMYVESVLSALAIFVWWNTQPGLLNHVCFNVFLVTTITTVIFNANPLMRFDGYYMLADFLEIPNLREKADKLLRDAFAGLCLGIDSQPDPFMPETRRPWFVAYALAAWLYRWLVVFGIVVFLYTFLKPYGLQSIGATLAAVSLGAMVVSPLVHFYKIVAAPRAEPLSRGRTIATLASLTLIAAVLLAVPIPIHYEAPFLIEPYGARDVYTTVSGTVVEVAVNFGQPVARGQVLAKLSNHEMHEKHAALETALRVQGAQVATQHAMENWSAYELAVQNLSMQQQELSDFRHQMSRLTITSPCEGILVAPARRPKRTPGTRETDLGVWYGTPFEEKNRDAFLAESTLLASIASDSDFQAVLLVDQADRRDLYLGQPVELKLEHLPDRTFTGVVEEISKRELDFAPRPLSNKYGGGLPTVTDAHGRETLSDGVAYQAKVRLHEETPLLVAGLSGRARFLVNSRTAADWIWQYCRRTFHFRL